MANSASNRIFEVGKRFGRVVLIEPPQFTPPPGKVKCRCDCGDERVYWTSNLRVQNQPMCPGCRLKSRPSKGHYKHPLFNIWKGIIQRCENPKHTFYARYGARGIAMCPRWRADFRAFAADMGARPSLQHTIDRIDPNGNYEPGNCRWLTNAEQQDNRSNGIRLQWRGREWTATEAAVEAGVEYATLVYRLKSGWTTERALETPSRRRAPPPT